MTDMEIALLRIRAWDALNGWGHDVELSEDDPRRVKLGQTTEHILNNFEERCATAEKLVTWALKQPIYPGEESK